MKRLRRLLQPWAHPMLYPRNVVPVIVGSAIAAGVFRLPVGLAAVAAYMLVRQVCVTVAEIFSDDEEEFYPERGVLDPADRVPPPPDVSWPGR